jgi:hypothetical protein
LLKQLDSYLPRSPNVEPHLRALRDLLASHSTRLWIVYLPSLVQVSDDYVKPQLELSRGPDRSFMGEQDQAQARAVEKTCSELGLPFLDLTLALRKREAEGTKMYWEFDGHMRPQGYAAAAAEILAWWLRVRGG